MKEKHLYFDEPASVTLVSLMHIYLESNAKSDRLEKLIVADQESYTSSSCRQILDVDSLSLMHANRKKKPCIF